MLLGQPYTYLGKHINLVFRLLNISCLILFFSISNHASSGTIRGYVYDITTGSPLTSATIHLESTDKFATSGLDGSFTISNIPEGKYTITINHSSFKPFEKLIEIKKNELIRINVEMVPINEKQLKEIIIRGKEIPGKEPLILNGFFANRQYCVGRSH